MRCMPAGLGAAGGFCKIHPAFVQPRNSWAFLECRNKAKHFKCLETTGASAHSLGKHPDILRGPLAVSHLGWSCLSLPRAVHFRQPLPLAFGQTLLSASDRER